MSTKCRLAVVVLAAVALVGTAAAADAQDRSRTKEIVVGLGAEPRTMRGATIVDWTTNNILEHIDDRLLDRDARTFRPRPMLATEWVVLWQQHDLYGVANTVEWTPRADETVWMYEAKVVAR